MLEIILGLSLLALYGAELFLASSVFVVVGGLIIAIAGFGGVKTSIQESACKYKVAEWLEEMVRCQQTLRLNLRVGFWLEEADRRIVDYLKYRRKHFRVLLRQVTLHYLLTAIGLAGMLGIGGYLVLNGRLSLGQLVAAELVVWSLFKALEKLLRSWESYFDLLTGLDKIGYITDLPMGNLGEAKLSTTTPGLTVDVNGLSYAHNPESAPIITDVSFSFKPGERIALLGPTGAGKSTLLKIMGGYLPPMAGSVELDRVDLRELSAESRTETIGFISERNELFAGSMIDNVAVGRECDLHRLRELLLETGARQALRQSPQGGFTPLTSAGSILSAGEQKGVLLSRALLTHPRLLLLDDSFGSMSEESINEVIDQVFDIQERPTIITTAAVPQVVAHCDRVLILENGRIVEDGKPIELASRSNSRLSELYPTLSICLPHMVGGNR